MTENEWTTIRVRTNARDAANERKPDDVTWSEWITDDARAPQDVNALAREIVNQIGTEVGGPTVDDDEIARAVARQLDYDALAGKVAERVVGELR